MSRRFITDAVWLAARVAGGAAATLLCLDGVVPAWAAGLAVVLWLASAQRLAGWPVWGGLVPLAAVLPGNGIATLAAWSAAGLGLGLGLQGLLQADPEALRRLRAELRDAEHERTLLSRHIQRYPALLDACLELSSTRELDQFASVLCQRTVDLLSEITRVQVFLGSPQALVCRAARRRQGEGGAEPAGADEIYVASEARPLIRRQTGSTRLLIPLRSGRRQEEERGDSLRGILAIDLVSGDVGDRLALDLLGALGRLGGLGLAAVDLVDQARSLALRDDLTGLLGQHEFLRRLDEQAADGRRHGEAIGLLMCDMDHLKRFNDQHGHAAGDAALRAVAKAILASLPADAVACRYGGEEFAALIRGVDAAALQRYGDALRAAIAASRLDGSAGEAAAAAAAMTRDAGEGPDADPHPRAAGSPSSPRLPPPTPSLPGSATSVFVAPDALPRLTARSAPPSPPTAADPPGQRRVTASIGLALLAGSEHPRAALARADAACYRAKALGRDRVVFA